MIHYVVVEPLNGKLELPDVPPVYAVGELVPEERAELAGNAPVLYCAEHPNEQMPALRERAEHACASGAPPVICAILECDKATHRLHSHLSARLALPKPEGEAAIFRYYDPRVFAHLRWILKREQLGALMGPVARWTYLDRQAGWVTVEGAKVPSDDFALTNAQYKQVARIEVIERALETRRFAAMARQSSPICRRCLTPNWRRARHTASSVRTFWLSLFTGPSSPLTSTVIRACGPYCRNPKSTPTRKPLRVGPSPTGRPLRAKASSTSDRCAVSNVNRTKKWHTTSTSRVSVN